MPKDDYIGIEGRLVGMNTEEINELELLGWLRSECDLVDGYFAVITA